MTGPHPITGPQTIPYGAWPSPISAADVARAGCRLSFPAPVGDEVWWTEGRPEEGGRQTVVRHTPDGRCHDLLPPPWNARTRVHEYGGRSWLAVPDPDGRGHALVFANFADQRLYRLDPGAAQPVPLTPEPASPSADRYAELLLHPDGRTLWCVRESHASGTVRRALVSVPLDGSGPVAELLRDGHFLANPRISPDGRRLAWLTWDHPRMPWDGTKLRVAEIGPDSAVGVPSTVLGGPAESVLQPEWAGPDELYAVSDRSGWWNLYRLAADGGPPYPLCPREEELGGPLWLLGTSFYALLDDGRIAVPHGTGTWRLGLLDPATGTLSDLDLPYTAWGGGLVAEGTVLAAVGAAPTRDAEVIRLDLATGVHQVLRRAQDERPDPAYLPVPEPVALPGVGGREVYANVYRPTHPTATAPAGELPPYVVFVHGGPTSQSPAVLDVEKAFFTSRGIGVLDVNYGGSTGHGRAYRERLRGQWGIIDVEDAVAAVLALADRGEADRGRLAIRGGSAGGWTTLAALVGTDVFACGTSYYGVAELLRFVHDTHDFESRYLDGLVGPLPAAAETYAERAPLSHVDSLSCPVLLLQGADDPVVPPSQAELFAEAMAKKGIPYAYLLFEGEQHGFRKAETIVACMHAELSFYGQVMGFDPPGIPRLALTR
ncbi:MAG TPA: prolyl oligopeptidase family serine peptidase [Mycobacteriales bacterium]|nr:prolyl oligopeptidase family serine peptidase [Mycobacteriales bacterium]